MASLLIRAGPLGLAIKPLAGEHFVNHPKRTHARRGFLLALATFCAVSVAAPADDTAQIVRTLKAQFDTPQQPLAVNPVSVEDTFAIAGWSQGGSGGRALLQRIGGSWQIVLCAGDSVLQPAALTAAGMSTGAATALAARVRAAESALPAAMRQQFASFANDRMPVRHDGLHAHAAQAPQDAHAATASRTNAAAGTVVVSQAWARATPAGITVGAGYLTMENRGRQADTLLAISSPIADSAGLHQTTTVNGMANMRMAATVVLAPGQTLRAEPRGMHVMLMGLKKPLVKGTKVPLVLTFRNAGAITVQVDILATDATAYENHAGH